VELVAPISASSELVGYPQPAAGQHGLTCWGVMVATREFIPDLFCCRTGMVGLGWAHGEYVRRRPPRG
jgi:hypothetical protein